MWPSLKHPHYGVFVENTYRELLRDGLDVSKIAICKHDTLFGKLKEYAFFFIKVVLGIASRRYEVVYAHYASHTACPILIGRVLNPRIRVVVNVHGNNIVPETGKDAFFVRHSKKLIAIAKFVISPSEYFARILEADFFVPREKIVVYPSGGVDTRLFAPRDRKLSREKFSFEKSNYVIGLFGRIEKDKGWDVFLQAAAQLIEREDKDYKLFVIGDGMSWRTHIAQLMYSCFQQDVRATALDWSVLRPCPVRLCLLLATNMDHQAMLLTAGIAYVSIHSGGNPFTKR